MTKDGELTLPEGTKVPHHIALIPDGNRRWARARGLPPFKGHQRGFELAPKIARACRNFGVHTVTIWAFSTENWKRSPQEVAYLMKLYEKFIDDHLEDAQKEDVRIIHLGRKDRIPQTLREKLEKAEVTTQNNQRYILNIALDYGGHDEILRAVSRIVKAVKKGRLKLEKLSFKNFLDTGGQPYPYPDLVIRTSGELRFSGFMPWQIAYAEFYFEPAHWPDFSPQKLRQAIIDYSNRQRRFGK